jgi:acetyl esterase/lipase
MGDMTHILYPNLLRAAALLVASTIMPSCAPVDALNASVSTRGLQIRRDIAYAPGPRGGLDLYRPALLPERPPLVVFIYGGSWKTGRKDDYQFVAAPLARAGLVVAVPDYRLYPEVRFPAFLEDNARAVAFARAHAAEWGADPERVFLIGHSAGAYNVAMLALDRHFLAAEGIAAQSLAGVVGIATPADFLPFRDADIRDIFSPASDPAVTQPVSFADDHNPPLLLLHGGADSTVYPRNSTSLTGRIKAAGGEVELKIYPEVGHIGIVTSFAPLFEGRAPVLADVMAFIRAHTETASAL